MQSIRRGDVMPDLVGVTPDKFVSVPVDIGAVERTIREVEIETGWRFALPGRGLVHQLFLSLAADQAGFTIDMTQGARESAIEQAYKALPDFLHDVTRKSQSLPSKGKEVGFPVVLHELDSWAVKIGCGCWPR
jgi:hypothetical protein